MALRYEEVPLADGALPVTLWEPASPTSTLVCVHGWTLDHRSFSGQAALAERGIRVVAFDRRGFGVNTLPSGLSRELEDPPMELHRLLLQYHLQNPNFVILVKVLKIHFQLNRLM